eukprot:gene11873-8160_t
MPGGFLHVTVALLRRGKPRPRAGMFPDKYRRVPTLLKPQQGGQQYFADFLTRRANEELLEQEQEQRGGQGGAYVYAWATAADPRQPSAESGGERNNEDEALRDVMRRSEDLRPRLPQMDLPNSMEAATARAVEAEMQQLREMDGFLTQRGFNERQWYDEELVRVKAEAKRKASERKLKEAALGTTSLASSSSSSLPTGGAPAAGGREEEPASADDSTDGVAGGRSALPQRIIGDDYFQERYGFSLLRRETSAQHPVGTPHIPPHLQGNPAAAAVTGETPAYGSSAGGLTAYSQLDLWAELPKYHPEMIFFYVISRRRNTYAVAYDYYGRRFLHPYTAGNRGLKGGDRGFRGDGSTDNGHQVASAYLNDLIPKIREFRADAGLPSLKHGDKVDVVLRVMGFYNGRQGAVRAVQDRGSEFNVRYVEDITPFPLNGPKMPKGVFR